MGKMLERISCMLIFYQGNWPIFVIYHQGHLRGAVVTCMPLVWMIHGSSPGLATVWKTLAVHPTVNGYLALFTCRAGEGRGVGHYPYNALPL